MTDGVQTPVALHDPLPESNWMWRRVFVFVVTAIVMWFIWGAMDRLGQASLIEPRRGVPALLELSKWLISLAMLMITCYLIAPSAETIVKGIGTVSMLKNGVQMVARAVTGADGASEVATTVSKPPAPPLPAPVPEHHDHDGPPWARS